jgi:uncharacterized membrane protein YdjX (TVP38/TMEM64 family)
MMPTTPDGRMPPPLLRRWRLGLVVVAVVGLLLAAGVLLSHVSSVAALTAEELRRWLHAAGHAAPFLFIAILLALNTIGLPAPILGAA